MIKDVLLNTDRLAVQERIPQSPPVISPLPQDIKRPLWSVMIPVYNCSLYLKETLQGVLQQDLGEDNMQIEVVDDASTDADVEQLVYDIGFGRVKYFRQDYNVGSLRNFQTCIERSKGKLIHILHGDDRVRLGFYDKMQAIFLQHPNTGAGFCRYAYIDELGKFLYNQQPEDSNTGILQNALVKLSERQKIQYVSMVVRREAYEQLGSFYGVEYGEDWEMWVRIAANYPVFYATDILAEYRKHRNSISGKAFLTGENMRNLEFVIYKIQAHLPSSERQKILIKNKKFYAHYALKIANSLWKDLRHKEGTVVQMREAWNMRKDVFLLYKIAKLYTRLTLNI